MSRHSADTKVATSPIDGRRCALADQCLDRRIDSLKVLSQEIEAWQIDRNNRPNLIDWQFTTNEARIKPKRLYPNL